MKVLLFADHSSARKLASSLQGRGHILVSTSEVPELANLLAKERFDLAVVDSRMENAEKACRHLDELCAIPLVLMVREKQADWAQLLPIDVDGYLPEGVKGAELVARLQAIWRRHSAARLNSLLLTLSPSTVERSVARR